MDEAEKDLLDALDALRDLLALYVKVADSGDVGFWDPEQEDEVIAARAVLAKRNPG